MFEHFLYIYACQFIIRVNLNQFGDFGVLFVHNNYNYFDIIKTDITSTWHTLHINEAALSLIK